MDTGRPAAPPRPAATPGWVARARSWLAGTTIQSRLARTFGLAILAPALVTAVVGVGMIRQGVYAQAQAQVDANLESARDIYQSHLDRLEDAIRIHATRMVIYGALTRGDTSGLAEEMDRIRAAERLDVLTLVDASGRVFYRSLNPTAPAGEPTDDPLIRSALARMQPAAATVVVPAEVLARNSPALAKRAVIAIEPTPRARPGALPQLTSGLMLRASAPVTTPAGRMLGVLDGGILLNRNSDIVDEIRRTVFKAEEYEGRPTGTATIFQDDVRVSTNVLAALTGSASGGLTIALDALGGTYMKLATELGIDPALMHRVAVIGAGTLDSLPHNGAVVTLLAVCGSTHGKSYFDIVMVGIVGAIVALVAVIVLGTMFGSF